MRRLLRSRRGLMLGLVAVAAAAAIFVPAAAASPPDKFTGSFSATSVLTEGCPFPITVDSTGTFTEIDYFDASGALTRVYVHVVEQDTFTAKNSLTGVPFTFNIEILFDSSGEVTQALASGIVEKVPLPSGGLFITAGLVDFIARGNPPFILTPDVGATVNLDAFCAALSQ